MKEKILAAIKAKFPKVNLSKQRLDELSAKIEAKCDQDETKIDVVIDEFNGFVSFEDIAKQDDQIRDLKSKVKPPAPPKTDPPTPTPPTEPADDDPMKKLLSAIENLTSKVTTLEGEKAASSRQSKLKEKLPDVPETYWAEWVKPASDEEIDPFVEKVKTSWGAISKGMTEESLAAMLKPGAGGGTVVSEKVPTEIKAYVEKNKQQQ